MTDNINDMPLSEALHEVRRGVKTYRAFARIEEALAHLQAGDQASRELDTKVATMRAEVDTLTVTAAELQRQADAAIVARDQAVAAAARVASDAQERSEAATVEGARLVSHAQTKAGEIVAGAQARAASIVAAAQALETALDAPKA